MDDGDDRTPYQEGIVDGELILSASSFTTYLRCPKQWEYAYVWKERRPPSLKQALGIASHTAYDMDMTAKMVTGENWPEDMVVDAFSTDYDRMRREEGLRLDEDDDPDKAKDLQVRVVRMYRQDLAPSIEPVLVEESFVIEVDGILYSGTLDLASITRVWTDPETLSERIKVRDWKNVAAKPSDTSNYALGMIGYALGYRAVTGAVESEVQIDYLVRYKKQKPGYYPISSGGPVSDLSVAGFSQALTDVRDSIMAGRFVAHGLQNGACSWCGYKDICPAYRTQNFTA